MGTGEKIDIGFVQWLIVSILSLLCCCPLGIIPIIFTILANNAATQGDREKAESNIKIAKITAIIFLVIGIPLNILGIIIQFAAAAGGGGGGF